MGRNDLIFELDRQLLDNEEVRLNKDLALQIIRTLKDYNELYERIENKNDFKERLIKEIKYKLEIIEETKCNHLILSDKSEYHHHRFITEKEKCDLLEEILLLIYN